MNKYRIFLIIIFSITVLCSCDPEVDFLVENKTESKIKIEYSTIMCEPEKKKVDLDSNERIELMKGNILGQNPYEDSITNFKNTVPFLNVYNENGMLIKNIDDFTNNDLKNGKEGLITITVTLIVK